MDASDGDGERLGQGDGLAVDAGRDRVDVRVGGDDPLLEATGRGDSEQPEGGAAMRPATAAGRAGATADNGLDGDESAGRKALAFEDDTGEARGRGCRRA